MTDLLTTPDPTLHVFRRKDALAAGINDRAIARLVKSGEWVRLRHGAYTDADTFARQDDLGRHALRCRAVLLQANTDVVASHLSALPEHGAPSWGLDLRTVHVTRRDRRGGRAEAGVRQHQGLLLPADVVERRGIQVTSATKTAIDVTTVLGVETALVQVNHLLHQRFTTAAELDARVAGMGRDPFTLRTDLVIRLASELIESVFESRTLYLCWRHALPWPEPQHKIRDASGEVVARLDFAWPERGCWIECDGRSKYVSLLREGESVADVVLREKAREDLVRRLTGWRCLRITWADLADPVRLAARIRAFLDETQVRR